MAAKKKKKEREAKRFRLRKGGLKTRKGISSISRIMVAVFAVVLVFVIVQGVIYTVDLKAKQNHANSELAKLKTEKKELKATLKDIDTPEYVEKAARDMLKMVMPGEILYVLKDQEEKTRPEDIVKQNDEEQEEQKE